MARSNRVQQAQSRQAADAVLFARGRDIMFHKGSAHGWRGSGAGRPSGDWQRGQFLKQCFMEASDQRCSLLVAYASRNLSYDAPPNDGLRPPDDD